MLNVVYCQLIIVVEHLPNVVRSQVDLETGWEKGIEIIPKFRKLNGQDTQAGGGGKRAWWVPLDTRLGWGIGLRFHCGWDGTLSPRKDSKSVSVTGSAEAPTADLCGQG